jgi:hypothetical protein
MNRARLHDVAWYCIAFWRSHPFAAGATTMLAIFLVALPIFAIWYRYVVFPAIVQDQIAMDEIRIDRARQIGRIEHISKVYPRVRDCLLAKEVTCK